MQKRKGFSLIELMVVIAIVGILVAIAVPAYKNYSIGAKMSQIVPLMDEFVQRSIEFATQKGRFISAGELLNPATTRTTNGYVVNASLATPYPYPVLQIVEANDTSDGYNYPGRCGAVGLIAFVLDGQELGIGGPNSSAVMECFMAHKNGTVDVKCMYSLNPNGTSTTAPGSSFRLPVHGVDQDYLPGWYNVATTSWGATYRAFIAGATCM